MQIKQFAKIKTHRFTTSALLVSSAVRNAETEMEFAHHRKHMIRSNDFTLQRVLSSVSRSSSSTCALTAVLPPSLGSIVIYEIFRDILSELNVLLV